MFGGHSAKFFKKIFKDIKDTDFRLSFFIFYFLLLSHLARNYIIVRFLYIFFQQKSKIMNSINANIPVVNMPQVGHQVADAHRAPAVHQAQVADQVRDKLDLQVRTAQEAEEAEGKTVDPDDHKENNQKGKKRENNDEENNDSDNENASSRNVAVSLTDGGHLIDLEA